MQLRAGLLLPLFYHCNTCITFLASTLHLSPELLKSILISIMSQCPQQNIHKFNCSCSDCSIQELWVSYERLQKALWMSQQSMEKDLVHQLPCPYCSYGWCPQEQINRKPVDQDLAGWLPTHPTCHWDAEVTWAGPHRAPFELLPTSCADLSRIKKVISLWHRFKQCVLKCT